MKKGMRVVRVPRYKPLDEQAKKDREEKARQTRALRAQAQLEAFNEFFKGKVPKERTTTRVASPPIVQPRPEPVRASTPTLQTPFKNPDLDDIPLRWSPRNFKPEIDRHNWSWSSWDSPSREIEDVSYQTDNCVVPGSFADLRPDIRDRIKEILAMKIEPPTHKTDSSSAESSSASSNLTDTVRYEAADFMGSFSSGDSTLSKSSEFSSWVDMDDIPWPPELFELWLKSERLRKERAEMPSLASKAHDNTRNSTPERLPTPPVPQLDMSSRSQSPEFSSWVDLGGMPKWSDAAVQSFSTYHRGLQIRHERTKSPDLSSSVDDSTDSSIEPTEDVTVPAGSPEFSSWVYVNDPKWPPVCVKVYNENEEEKRAQAIALQKATISKDCGSDDSRLSRANSDDSYYKYIRARRHLVPVPRPASSEPELETRAPSPVPSPALPPSPTASSLSFISPSVALATAAPLSEQVNFTAPVYQQAPSTRAWAAESSAAQHFHTLRQLPSAIATEPQQSRVEEAPRGSGFGWKSLACVAVAAAAVGAGIAYWMSG